MDLLYQYGFVSSILSLFSWKGLYEIATEVDRYTVMNTQKPTSAAIAIDEQVEMEDFIDNVAVQTFGMGHKVFEPLIKKIAQ